MSIEKRILMCRLIEKMYEQKEYSQKLGIENRSVFRGEHMVRKEEEIC